ncbi:hypothetical protein MHYP_G00323090 [Metynnis hypsauchen]
MISQNCWPPAHKYHPILCWTQFQWAGRCTRPALTVSFPRFATWYTSTTVTALLKLPQHFFCIGQGEKTPTTLNRPPQEFNHCSPANYSTQHTRHVTGARAEGSVVSYQYTSLLWRMAGVLSDAQLMHHIAAAAVQKSRRSRKRSARIAGEEKEEKKARSGSSRPGTVSELLAKSKHERTKNVEPLALFHRSAPLHLPPLLLLLLLFFLPPLVLLNLQRGKVSPGSVRVEMSSAHFSGGFGFSRLDVEGVIQVSVVVRSDRLLSCDFGPGVTLIRVVVKTKRMVPLCRR